MIIQAISIKKTIGGNPLFEDLSCQIEAGEKIALVGINGTGKSTFLQILTGRDRDGRTRTYSFRSNRQPLLAPFCR